MKTRKALLKRISVKPSGKVKHWSAFTSHLAQTKTPKQKRQSRKASYMDSSDLKRFKGMY